MTLTKNLPIILLALFLISCSSDKDQDSNQTNSENNTQNTANVITNLNNTDISPQKAQELLQKNPQTTILDVRTPQEFQQGHLQDALNFDFYEATFKDELNQLDKNTPYLVYCRSGNRSGQTISLMQELDFQNVQHIEGGITAWQEAGYQLVK